MGRLRVHLAPRITRNDSLFVSEHSVPTRSWRGISNGAGVAEIERAIALGCRRKYTSMLAPGAAWMPIASLSFYFTSIIAEVCQTSTPDSYWAYSGRRTAEVARG